MSFLFISLLFFFFKSEETFKIKNLLFELIFLISIDLSYFMFGQSANFLKIYYII